MKQSPVLYIYPGLLMKQSPVLYIHLGLLMKQSPCSIYTPRIIDETITCSMYNQCKGYRFLELPYIPDRYVALKTQISLYKYKMGLEVRI